MKNLLYRCADWFEPFRYEWPSYYSHLRVRVFWWLRFAYGAVFAGVLGYLIAVSAMAWEMLGPKTTTVEIIARYAAWVCRTHGLCSSEHLTGIIVAFGFASVGVGWVIWFMAPSHYDLKPDKVTDAKLEEWLQLGYIVMESEDYEDAINGQVSDRLAMLGLSGNHPESVELGQAGTMDSGPTAPGAVLVESTAADRR